MLKIVFVILIKRILHANLNKFGPTITGDAIWFDNFNVWEAKQT